MNAAARVSLQKLLDEGSLERVPVDRHTAEQLVGHAGKHVQTAALGLSIDDNEGCFLLSYDACRKVCTGLLAAMGLRARGEGHHATVFEAVAFVAESFGQRTAVDEAADLRWARHGSEYRGESIDPADAKDALAIANELIVALKGPMEKILGT